MKVDVNEALNQIAKGFNVAVEELYPILYKQAILSGFFNLMWVVVFASLIGAFAYFIRYAFKKQKEQGYGHEWDWDEPRQIIVIIIGSVITGTGMIVIPVSIEGAVTAFFNTEYYVLRDILSKLK